MHEIQYQGEEEARRAFHANLSPRYVEIDELESWVTGRQYDGRPDWWTGGAKEVPRWERKPCFVYPVVQVAISSNTDLTLGEGRFPGITSKPGENEGDLDRGLSEEQSEKLDRFLAEYHKVCRFKAHIREGFSAAQGSRTAVAIHGYRNGKPFADLVPSKWCEPTFEGEAVSRLEIRYPYLEKKRIHGKWTLKAKLYRRVIDAQADTTFLPVDAREDGEEPTNWTPDPAQTVQHGLGFCPVVWYPFMRGCAPVNRIDGFAIHENIRDEIAGLDLAMSQKQTCCLYSEPQPIEIGVSPGYNPTGELGRTAVVPSTEHGGDGPTAGAPTGAFLDGPATAPARKKGPGHIWSYSDPNTKVEYLKWPTGLLEEQEKHCSDLLQKIEQSMAVVLPKPSEFKFAGAVSGRSLQETKSRQYDRCDQYRDDIEAGFILPSVSMQLRIAQRAREQLNVPGIAEVLPILDRFSDELVESQPDA